MRQYISNEKDLVRQDSGCSDYDWEVRWDPSDFLRNRRLHEAVRVMHALGGELTEREHDYLCRLGIIGDARRAIAEEDLSTGVGK